MQVWETVEGPTDVKMRILSRNLGAVFSLDISPDGKYLIAGSSRGIVKIWDLETNVEKLSLYQCLSPGVRRVVFSPDGRSFAAVGHNSGSYDQKIKTPVPPQLSVRMASISWEWILSEAASSRYGTLPVAS